MDGLDVAIIRELMQEDVASPLTNDPMRSLRAIAAKLGVDKDTVRARLAHLEARRFQLRSGVMIHPALARLRFAQVWVEGVAPAQKRAWVERLREHPNLLVVTDYVGDAVNLAALRPEEVSPEAFLATLPPVAARASTTYREMRMPPCAVSLTAADRRIVDALASGASRGHAEVAQATGLGAKTVQRRLSRMIEERALFVVPSFHPESLDASAADLVVFYADTAVKPRVDREIAQHLRDRVFRMDLLNPDHSFFNLVLDNAARARGIADWVSGRDGVASARLDLIQERIELPQHLGPLFAARLPKA